MLALCNSKRLIMSSLDVGLEARSYQINIEKGLLDLKESFALLSATSQVVIVTNTTIAYEYKYADKLTHTIESLGASVRQLVLPDGESYKTLHTFEKAISYLLENNYNRDVWLIALGGGVIGDITGFVAASYQRGVNFIQVPTTLLAQVDSSVGGKTGVNHALGKNMIGAFYQPQAVVIDINCLQTLPQKELAAGMAEVIKYGIILDKDFFIWLEQNIENIYALEHQALDYVITKCCQLKRDVVSLDEKENNLRALLNLGHTFGHAIEAHMGYGNWLHGEAVAVGIIMASELAVKRCELTSLEFNRIKALLERAKLPIKAPKEMNYNDFIKHMSHDKKVKDGKLRLIIPNGIGKSQLIDSIDIEQLEQAIITHIS